MLVIVNEWCQGLWTPDGMQFNQLDCQIIPDPITGISVPTFFLPQPVFAGDVLALEPTTGQVSDVLRFPGQPGQLTELMSFWSDVDDQEPNPPPSDIGLPPFFLPNAVRVFEMGTPEIFDFFIQVAGQAMYIAISDTPTEGGGPPTGALADSEKAAELAAQRLQYHQEQAK
jgi:hypothetical protein